MKRPHITVIGATAVDVKASSFGELARRGDVPGRVRVMVGGVAHNVAKNLALLGAEVAVLSVIGDDPFGRMIYVDLAQAGANVEQVIVQRACATATWVGILDAQGDLDVGVFGGEILDALTPNLVRAHAAAITHADLIALDATLPRATIDAIIALAKTQQTPLYLNPASVARAQTIADCIGAFTLVTANALEASVITGQPIHTANDATRAAHALIARGVQRVIVTLGAAGLVYADARATCHLPALPTQVADTTGAGDALGAAFVLGHLDGCPLAETLDRALHAAAITAACETSVSEKISTLQF